MTIKGSVSLTNTGTDRQSGQKLLLTTQTHRFQREFKLLTTKYQSISNLIIEKEKNSGKCRQFKSSKQILIITFFLIVSQNRTFQTTTKIGRENEEFT